MARNRNLGKIIAIADMALDRVTGHPQAMLAAKDQKPWGLQGSLDTPPLTSHIFFGCLGPVEVVVHEVPTCAKV